MENFIRQQYNRFSFSEEDIELIKSVAEEEVLPKGSYVVEEGKVNSRFYLVAEGVLRAYRSNDERDTTLWFAVKGEALFSSWGYVQDKPSRLHIVTSSDCRLFVFRREDVKKLMVSSPALCIWFQHLVEVLLLTTDEFLIDISKPTAKERYLTFIQRMPEILQEVPLKEIAGYLGMTPQSLSRIRAEIVGKK